ncbi:MAG: YkgJ family cysteine cluster protein [Deltaproteobacteria bacterium]|nr:YkgJ family cysteine cluster protein [Deltaproteobacteria bacterium]MBW1938624.1 YkgJ family cysteine cluster protein [Deltaproteobacteria bacterium]MBW2349959.1 YkgJ family cysteine cluster protein [Deltaproteobacteria bacterium]
MESEKKIESCIRCGECCEKGGPALHSEDRIFLQKGTLRPIHLFTLRAGELAYHPLEERLIELSDEMIKIKGKDGSSACTFYDAQQKACSIYEDRPLECRVLKCWDTEEVEGLFMKDLLSRLDLCPKGSVVAEMISAYERSFSPSRVYGLLSEAASTEGAQETGPEIEQMVSTDEAFRQKVVETLGLKEKEFEFFFGRPVKALVANIQTLMDHKTK